MNSIVSQARRDDTAHKDGTAMSTVETWIKEIETLGYCRIPQLYDPERIDRTLALVKSEYEKSRETLAKDLPRLAKNDPFLWNPQNKDFFFLEMLFGAPEIEQILMHFLNDRWFTQIPPDRPNYILRSFMARTSNEVLPMHIDSLVPYGGDHVFVMQTSIILEDQDEENGCTVVMPGSHLTGDYVDHEKTFDMATPLPAKAGDVLVWDSRIWHGAGKNTAEGRTRWTLITTYCRWWIKQMFDITGSLPPDFYERLTDSQKAVLGYCSIPWADETKGIDMKKGYDSLAPDNAAYRR